MELILVRDAIVLPFFWLLAFAFITFTGFAFAPFKHQRGTLSNNIFTWFWYGIAVLVAFLQLWNLFWPINGFAWICLTPATVWGAIQFSRSDIMKAIARPGTPVVLLGLLIVCFLILSSLNNQFIYDTRVYHFYNIKWFNSYPVTPGMGNLFPYLGVNQSYFLFSGFLNRLWHNYRGACATNGLLALAVCSEILVTNVSAFRKKATLSFHGAFQLLFLPLCINAGVQTLSSPTPDVFVNLLTFKILSDLIKCLETRKTRFQDIFLFAIYGVLGVVMKLSFIGVALGMFPVIVLLSVPEKLFTFRLSIKAILLCLLFLFLPWMVRGVVATGYAGFPLSAFGVPVDWKMPKNGVDAYADYVKGFARTHLHGKAPLEAAHNYLWIPRWIKYSLKTFGFTVPLLLCLGSLLVLRIRNIRISPLLFVFLPLFIALGFWLCTAPDVRFAVNTFWALGLVPLAYVIIHIKAKWINNFSVVIYACCILIMIRNWNRDPAPLGDLPKQVPAVFITKSGLKINTISNAPPNDIYTINDCTIPCSFLPDSNLALRGKSIRDGFKIVNK